MYAVLVIYIFFECLFLSRSDLINHVYRSVDQPGNLKLKLDGTIDLPFGASGTDEETYKIPGREQYNDKETGKPYRNGEDSLSDNNDKYVGPVRLKHHKVTSEEDSIEKSMPFVTSRYADRDVSSESDTGKKATVESNLWSEEHSQSAMRDDSEEKSEYGVRVTSMDNGANEFRAGSDETTIKLVFKDSSANDDRTEKQRDANDKESSMRDDSEEKSEHGVRVTSMDNGANEFRAGSDETTIKLGFKESSANDDGTEKQRDTNDKESSMRDDSEEKSEHGVRVTSMDNGANEFRAGSDETTIKLGFKESSASDDGTEKQRDTNDKESSTSKKPTTAKAKQKSTKFHPHKVKDDDRVRKFSAHVYDQALKAFEAMSKKADAYTQEKIASLAEMYKSKFSDFVHKTRQLEIKTKEGTQNVILHTIDTSNLIMQRILNFLNTEPIGSDMGALRQGSPRMRKEVDTVKQLELEHACKKYGICRSANAFRNELQNIISILLQLSDNQILQANDAATEILKDADLSAFCFSDEVQQRALKSIKSLERAKASRLRSNLQILFGVLSQSHLPLIVDKGKTVETPAVKRTVSFHSLLDAIDDALPANEANRSLWLDITQRLKRWRDGEPINILETWKMLFDNVNNGARMFGEKSNKIKKMVDEIAGSVVDDD